jgi:epoxyqueuosine reductase
VASTISGDELCAVGLAAGLHRVGVASAAPFEDVRVTLERRKAAGLHGGMQFSYRNPARSTDPQGVVAGAQSLVVGALAYPAVVRPPSAAQRQRGPLARVARYATDDHYARLRAALEEIAACLRGAGWVARVVADDNALVDRAAAHRAGIGWYGKNSNLLVDGAGSWFVLGSVVTDAPLLADPADAPVPAAMASGCGGCTRCITGCPTGAIVEPGVVDARRCLAWLVQAEGVFPLEHRIALGDRLYGCDECQEVCPPSARTERQEGSGGDGPPTASSPGAVSPVAAPASADAGWVPLLDVLSATDEELLAAHGRWYIARRDPDHLRRNALVALGNAASLPVADDVRDAVERHCRHPRALVRAHAVWAARRLGLHACIDPLQDDEDPLVRAELAAEVPARAGSPGTERSHPLRRASPPGAPVR